jgi:hypothetical protein
VRIVKLGYRRLSHKKGGRRGTGENRKKEGRKKKGWQSESEAWGKIKRETCNFDLFYDLWTGPAGEINTDEAELKGILHPPYLVSRCHPWISPGLQTGLDRGPHSFTSSLFPLALTLAQVDHAFPRFRVYPISHSVRPIISPIHLRRFLSFFSLLAPINDYYFRSLPLRA